jgi:hypothetical protein
MCFAQLTSQHYPGRASGRWAYAPHGVVVPFRGVRRGGRTGAGITVSRDDARHFAQCSYSVGDGRTTAGCPYSVETGFPGGVRRSTWWGFPFDPGARGMSRHLMLRSGEQVRCRGSRGSLERDGDSLEGLEPSSEAKIRLEGLETSSEAEIRFEGPGPSNEARVHLGAPGPRAGRESATWRPPPPPPATPSSERRSTRGRLGMAI